MSSPFEIIGYHIDYYVRGKYFGSVTVDQPDRDTLGYEGRMTQIITEEVWTSRGVLKTGTEVRTECVTLCGKLITDNQEDRFNILREYYQKQIYKRR